MNRFTLISVLAATLSLPHIAWGQEAKYIPLVKSIPGIADGNFTQYFNSIFDIAVLIGSILAVIVIAVGGVQYMTTDAVLQKKDSVRKIQMALAGLLMLLATFLFFNQINPNILNLNITAPTSPNTGVNAAQRPATNNSLSPTVRAQNNPILPGSSVGTNYTNPTWTALGFNQQCNDVRGSGWVTIDAHHCAGASPGSSSYCCGQDPSYTPPATTPPSSDTPVEQGESFYPESDRGSIPSGAWCYDLDGGGAVCYSTENGCNGGAAIETIAILNSCSEQ